MEFLKLIPNRRRSVDLVSNVGTPRFQLRVGYAPVTILSRAGYDYAALLSRFCGASFPWRFYYDPTKTMKIRLRLVYADGDAVATMLRPRRWSYAFVAILIPFLYKIDS